MRPNTESVVKTLEEYFLHTKKPYKILWYKDVPISHIRLHKSYYAISEDHIINSCKLLGVDKEISLLDKMIVIAEKYNLFSEQKYFEKEIRELNLDNDDSRICAHIVSWCQTQIFSNILNYFEKFNDPIIANDDLTTGLLHVHPGATRLRTLEYLFLKNKKEYFVDVVFYKTSGTSLNQNMGFLIDKNPIVINTLDDFVKVYGYQSIDDFKNDLDNIRVITQVPIGKVWIAKPTNVTNSEVCDALIKFKELLTDKIG